MVPDDFGCPCGGTHVPHVKDIEEINITKITKKGKNVRVSYTVKAP
jgi:Ser-tRNA(Ala) deacylase AlaX